MKTKAKKRYRLKSGEIVVGTTTVKNLLAKPPLYNWYWKLGRDGIDHRRHLDHLANIGILTHSMIFHYLQGKEADTSDYSQNQIKPAMNSFELFLKWEKQHELAPILLEKQLVSEEHRYGGTPDFYGWVDGERTLLDFKSSGVYEDQFVQLAAYANLLKEGGWKVGNHRILVMPIDKNKGLEDAQREDVSVAFEIFLHCLDIYKLKKGLK